MKTRKPEDQKTRRPEKPEDEDEVIEDVFPFSRFPVFPFSHFSAADSLVIGAGTSIGQWWR